VALIKQIKTILMQMKLFKQTEKTGILIE